MLYEVITPQPEEALLAEPARGFPAARLLQTERGVVHTGKVQQRDDLV